MKTRTHIKAMIAVFVALFLVLSVYLVYIVDAYGSRWLSSPYNSRLKTLRSSVTAGSILDRNGLVLCYTDSDGQRRYRDSRGERRAVCHITGDVYGQTLGAEAMFSKYTLGFDQEGLESISQYITDGKRRGADVALTIDAGLCDYAYDLMDDYWGAAVVMNYKTGEVLASVSQPTFDPEYMADYLDGSRELAGSAMVNRVTMGRYTPGSVFKLVTLTAALRYIPNVEERVFNCEGQLCFDAHTGEFLPDVKAFPSVDGDDAQTNYDRATDHVSDEGAQPQSDGSIAYVRDYHDEYHGNLTLERALASSCNNTFARLAMELGADRLAKTASELGFGAEFAFDDMAAYSGRFEKAQSELFLAWSGVGQYKDIATPIHMCLIASAIANGGTAVEPKLLMSVKSARSSSARVNKLESEAYMNMLRGAEADTIKGYMREAVQSGTATGAAVKGYTVCGKTGTAEISSDKNVKSHAWFVGFIDDETHPYAVCVILEQAGGGGAVAAPIAGKLLARAVDSIDQGII